MVKFLSFALISILSHSYSKEETDCAPGTSGCCSTMIPPSIVPPDDSSCWKWWDPPVDGILPPGADPPPKGCDYAPCQRAVCECDDYCCNAAWDLSCRGENFDSSIDNYFVGECSAKNLCCEDKKNEVSPDDSFECSPGTSGCCNTLIPPSFIPPNDSSCWKWWDPPADGILPPGADPPPKGCDYTPCQRAVCECDDYCCNAAWDISCRGREDQEATSAACSAKVLCCEDGLSPDFISKCSEPRSGYTETSLMSINNQMDGMEVMVTWPIQNSDLAACTTMACPQNDICCNSCTASASFDNVALVSSNGENSVGCEGTECDYEDNCVYSNGDIVTVYGKIKVNNGQTLIDIDDHCVATPTCMDFGLGVGFGPCEMLMGYGVVKGECQVISGCGSNEYVFFSNLNDCKSACAENTEPRASCKDYSNMEFGFCQMLLGYGVVNGYCSSIGGCGNEGETFFESMEDCKANCNASCKDYNNMDFGLCKMLLGYGVVNGSCSSIGGCNNEGERFFESMKECEANCS